MKNDRIKADPEHVMALAINGSLPEETTKRVLAEAQGGEKSSSKTPLTDELREWLDQRKPDFGLALGKALTLCEELEAGRSATERYNWPTCSACGQHYPPYKPYKQRAAQSETAPTSAELRRTLLGDSSLNGAYSYRAPFSWMDLDGQLYVVDADKRLLSFIEVADLLNQQSGPSRSQAVHESTEIAEIRDELRIAASTRSGGD